MQRAGEHKKFSMLKRTQFFNGREYLLEDSLNADYAIIKAWKADKSGNLLFKSSARNLNPEMAMACKQTIVEVEEIVEDGEIHPDQVHLPGIFVHKIVKASPLLAP